MGIKERQGREREAVRRAILDAARDLFVREGYDRVSIRKVAERIEYSPAAIYGYFASKDDIFFELAEEGFRLLAEPDPATRARIDALDPLARVRAIFWRFYEFSRDHPQYFALMFVDRSVPRITQAYERFEFAHEMKGRLIGHLETCVDAGLLPAAMPPAVAFRVLTTAMIGVSLMRLSDRLGPRENIDALAADVLDVTLAGLRSGVTLHSSPIACPIDSHRTDSQPATDVVSADTLVN